MFYKPTLNDAENFAFPVYCYLNSSYRRFQLDSFSQIAEKFLVSLSITGIKFKKAVDGTKCLDSLEKNTYLYL